MVAAMFLGKLKKQHQSFFIYLSLWVLIYWHNLLFKRVIPRALVPIEISGHAVGQVVIVSDMHERKAEMASRADAFIALPGMHLSHFYK